ncbi:quinate permease [Apiospora kogelbergensis]|uniref:quinate permease n=1 Tax=Apiospora kogelbergensis TaxID=1337665 RepID=UPI00313227D3
MASSTRLYNWYICMVAATCMVLYGYDASVFNAAQGSANWLNYFDLHKKDDAYLIGLVNTAYTIGAIVGGFFMAGPLADYFGRRVAFAPRHNLGCFIGGRVLIGIGQGLSLTAGATYISEVAPSDIRGTIMTFWQLNYSVGSFIAYWIAYATSLNIKRLGDWDWKLVVIFQLLCPVTICSLIFLQPESPRWWIQRHNDVAKCRAALTKIRATEAEIEDEVLAIREAIEFEKEAISSSYWALFKDPSVRRRLWLAFALNIGQQLSGQGTLNSYSTSIYMKIWDSKQTINLINALNATCGILFTLNAAWTADRFGRRWLLIFGAVGMAVSIGIVAIVAGATPSTESGAKSQPVGIAIVFLLFLFIFFYKPSWGATVWIWTAEVFSVNVRAQAVGMCSQMQNVANTIFQQFFPVFLAREGLKCLYFFMAVNILLAVFVWFLVPETKQNHVEKGGQMMGVPDPHHAADTTEEKAAVETREVRSV